METLDDKYAEAVNLYESTVMEFYEQMKPLHIYSILIAAGFISVALLLGDAFGLVAIGLLCLIAAIDHKL